jgi:hypothetical protein
MRFIQSSLSCQAYDSRVIRANFVSRRLTLH